MIDIELLECAANHAKIECRKIQGFEYLGLCLGESPSPFKKWWNPLIDDGDALRLATELKIEYLHDSYQNDDGDLGVVAYGPKGNSIFIRYGADKHAATRKAIVLAAAEEY